MTCTLVDGLAGDDVRAVQDRLKALGFDPGPIDGRYGELTRAAIRAFEKLATALRDVAHSRPTLPSRSRRRSPSSPTCSVCSDRAQNVPSTAPGWATMSKAPVLVGYEVGHYLNTFPDGIQSSHRSGTPER